MRVRILGPLQVATDQTVVEIGGARLRALLTRLALDVGRTVTVAELSAALWPQRGPADPVNAVQRLVSRLRQALPASEVLRSSAGGYRLALPPEAVDAVEFERLASQGRQALTGGDPDTAARLLRQALALWRGEALAEVADSPYPAAAAVRLTELRLAATEDRIAAELAAGRPAGLVAEARQLVATHPMRERLRTLLVRVLHAEGRHAEALAAFEQFRRLLADEHGADPGPELRAAHLAVLRDEPAGTRPSSGQPSVPPPVAGRRPGGNLRAELTSLVGRAAQRQQLATQLAQVRLVTLVGAGGAGKTRLASAVAADLAASAPAGVWLVELAAESDPEAVAPAVARALGLRETTRPEAPTGPADPLGRLADTLAASEALIVLDNCEHLLDAAARLADRLLRRCPRLRILATSREPLGISGEVLVPVPPLALPAPYAPVTEALAAPAVRLFADRAAEVRPDFAVTDGNVATVAEICRRLDGLPLAIELAAARLRSLPLDQVAARLDDRFRLLARGSRTAAARHQTLRAVVAWSWDLLAPGERRVAQRLAVFPGAITLAGAARVCGFDLAMSDTLAALVDKSLLQLRDGAEPQYRMLETIREYAWERLVEVGELTEVQAAHAAYYLDLAEEAALHLRGAGQLPWLARLAADSGSPAAFQFARTTGDADTIVRLSAALSYFWTIMGDHARVASHLRTALEVPGPSPPAARAIATASYLFNTLLGGGDPAAAVEFCRRHRDWEIKQPAAALVEAALAFVDHDTAAGLAATDRHLSDPDPWVRGMLWLLRSWLHGNDGATAEHRQALDAAVAAFRAAGERWGLATCLTHRAHARITDGEFDAAIAALSEAIVLLQELDPADLAMQQRVLLAAVRAQQGDRARARRELAELVAPPLGWCAASNLALARIALGDLARLDGELAQAQQQYEAAAQELARVPFDASLLRAMLLCARGHLAVASGELEAAQRHLAEALTRAIEVPDLVMAAEVAVPVARLRWQAGTRAPHRQDQLGRWHGGAVDTAAELLGAAEALRGSPDAYDPDVAELSGALRGELGERAFQAAYARGRGLDRADALALVQAQLSG